MHTVSIAGRSPGAPPCAVAGRHGARRPGRDGRCVVSDGGREPQRPSDRPAGRPLTLAERRRLAPPRLAKLGVRLAVAQLPARQRRRYALEFLAEMHGMTGREQIAYSFALAANGLRLRGALRGAPAPAVDLAVVPRPRRHLSCWLLLHRFVERRNEEGDAYTECRHCGKYTVTQERGNAMLPPPL